jgi:putative PIN family toxin of toxin-antitoxin system
LDSSVLISAFLTPRGVPDRVLDAAERGDFILCLSAEILAETATALLANPKLQARYGYDQAAVEAFCDGFTAAAEMARDLPILQAVPNDPKDNMVIATAVAAKAGYLVTGDRKHLLPLGGYETIRIVTPREFLDLLGAVGTQA